MAAIKNPGNHEIYAVCAPGLEPYTRREIEDLSFSAKAEILEDAGGVRFPGILRDVYLANLSLRTANRVLFSIGTFPVQTFPALRQKGAHLRWEDYLRPGQPIHLRVACHHSRLYHSGAAAEYVAKAIADRLGQDPPIQKPTEANSSASPQLIGVRIVKNICTISVDSSGALLYRRGYRLATAKAPIRETLAAGMLMASGWDMRSPLLDPFCGSGTIAIEAALMARKIKPGRARHFAFMDWPNYAPQLWQDLLPENSAVPNFPSPLISAADRDAGAIRAAAANATRAGISDFISFSHLPFSAMEPPSQIGWVVTNPPFGIRLKSNRDLRTLYKRLGEVLRKKCRGWKMAMLGEDPSLVRLTEIGFDQGIPVFHGGRKVRLFRSEIF
jgi:putative N6-adenine-specific DNA methylase